MQRIWKTLLLVSTTFCWGQDYFKPETHYVEGRAEYLPKREVSWSNLSLGQRLDHNTTLKTHDASQAEFKFDNSWYFRMSENSHLQYLFSRGDGYNQMSFSSIKGDFFFHTPACEKCHHTKVSWYLDSNVIQGEQASFYAKSLGKATQLDIIKGSLVVRRGDKVRLVKAPSRVFLKTGQITIQKLQTPQPLARLTQAKVDETIEAQAPKNFRKGVYFQVEAAPDLKQGKWDVEHFLLSWHQGYFDSLGVYFYKDSIQLDGSSSLSKQKQSQFHLAKVNIKEFNLNTSPANWNLVIDVDFELYNPISKALEDSWSFRKLYQGKSSRDVDLRLLKYLPLDNRNQKIKDSFFEKLWQDYQAENLKRLVDPLYTSEKDVF